MEDLDVFLISPVTDISKKDYEGCQKYVEKLESQGKKVWWPIRDTPGEADPNMSDPMPLFQANRLAMRRAREIHIWYAPTSIGSHFDLGMWFAFILAFRKSLVLANPEEIEPTNHRSYQNFLLGIHKAKFFREARELRRKSNCERGQVGAAVVKDGKIISRGWNFCQAPVLNKGCQRKNLSPGISQWLCATVHCEVAALLNVRPNRSSEDFAKCRMPARPTAKLIRELFTKEERALLRGAVIYFSGLHYSCDNCRRWCRLLKVSVEGDPIYGKKGD